MQDDSKAQQTSRPLGVGQTQSIFRRTRARRLARSIVYSQWSTASDEEICDESFFTPGEDHSRANTMNCSPFCVSIAQIPVLCTSRNS